MQTATMSLILMLVAANITAAYAADQVNTPPTTTTTSPAAIVAAVDDGDKVICRSEPNTGSLISKRICAKKSQWEHAGGVSKHAIQEHAGDVSKQTVQDTGRSLQPPGR